LPNLGDTSVSGQQESNLPLPHGGGYLRYPPRIRHPDTDGRDQERFYPSWSLLCPNWEDGACEYLQHGLGFPSPASALPNVITNLASIRADIAWTSFGFSLSPQRQVANQSCLPGITASISGPLPSQSNYRSSLGTSLACSLPSQGPVPALGKTTEH
jgi:hypothetical protein